MTLKIAHVNNIANVASNFAEGLISLGQIVTVIPLEISGGSLPLFWKFMYSPIRLISLALVNRRIMLSSFDLVHIHYAYLGWLGILGGYEYFLHCHGTDVRMDLTHPLRRLWVLPALKKAHKVLFSTPDLSKVVVPVRPDALFLPNPVRVDLFAPDDNLISETTGNFINILIHSELNDEIKGTNIAIEALSKIRDKYPEIKVSTIAKGKDLAKYRRFPWIEFINPLPYSDMPSFVRRFDLVIGQFVLGSLGMSELEAMACAKPVICYFNYPDFYPEPPPVLSTNISRQLVDFLSKLIEDKEERRFIGFSGREWVKRYHDYTQISRSLLEIYRTREISRLCFFDPRIGV